MKATVATGAAVSALLATVTWFGVDRAAPRLASGGGTNEVGFEQGAHVPSRSEVRSFSMPDLCMTGDASATVTKVGFLESSGLVVRDFGVQEFDRGGHTVDATGPSLASKGWHRKPVTTRCGGPGKLTFVAYTLGMEGTDLAWARGLAIDYVVEGRSQRLELPGIEHFLCVGDIHTTPCDVPERDETEG